MVATVTQQDFVPADKKENRTKIEAFGSVIKDTLDNAINAAKEAARDLLKAEALRLADDIEKKKKWDDPSIFYAYEEGQWSISFETIRDAPGFVAVAHLTGEFFTLSEE